MQDEEGTRVSEAMPAYTVQPATSPATIPFAPREKMRKRSVKVLSDTELLTVVLGDSKREACKRLVHTFGLEAIAIMTVKDLLKTPGVGLSAAQRLVAVFELQHRIRSVEYRSRPRLVRPFDVARLVTDIKHLKKEHMIGLYLDAQNGLIHRETLSIGSLNITRTNPREILYPAIEHTACGFILAHNHPSGGLDPSDEDVAFTRAVHRAGELMGIDLYDHVIVAPAGFTSLRERGVF